MTGYDEIATWYDELLESNPLYRDVVLPTLLDLAGDVSGQSICDLACGQGWIARELARRGAHVTGVDISGELLDMARRYENEDPLGIHYVLDDAQELETLPARSFDGVTCVMALMNIADIDAAFRAIRQILRPAGWFAFIITHPCFETPNSRWIVGADDGIVRAVGSYFDEGYWTSENPDSLRHKVGDHHRMLSTYLNSLAGAEFLLDLVEEPGATGERARQVPGNREVPTILALRARQGVQT